MPRIFPVLSAADKAAHASESFSSMFRYIGTRAPVVATGKYIIKCLGYDGTPYEREHSTEDFEITDPRVARCLELHIDYFTQELDYLRVS